MKYQIIFITSVLALFLTATKVGHSNSKPGLNLIVNTTGIANYNGQLCARLYTNEVGFPMTKGAAIREIIFPLATLKSNSAKNMSFVFSNLSPAKYAVAILHDKNNNLKIELNPLGIPTEGTGTSLNVRPPFSAPTFSQSAFYLSTNATIQIKLHY